MAWSGQYPLDNFGRNALNVLHSSMSSRAMSVAGLEERLSSSTKRVWLRETSRWRTLGIKIVMMPVTWLLNSASATRWYPGVELY